MIKNWMMNNSKFAIAALTITIGLACNIPASAHVRFHLGFGSGDFDVIFPELEFDRKRQISSGIFN